MPIGYKYKCNQCDHDWLLFSHRFAIGPVQWGAIRYVCYTCQTFLSVPESIDRNSWEHWLANNTDEISKNSKLQFLTKSITDRLSVKSGLTPIKLTFNSIECPTCESDKLSTIPFGEHNMRCSKCGDYTGTFVDENGVTIYGPADTDRENAG